jgi:hypothetical protein
MEVCNQPLERGIMKDEIGNNASTGLGIWIGGTGEAWQRWMQSTSNVMKGVVELSQEAATFAQKRFQADFDSWKSLTECRSASDVLDCQRRYAAQAATQYFDEASRAPSRILALMTNAAAPTRQERAPKS